MSDRSIIALLVGIDVYESDDVSDLSGCVNDVTCHCDRCWSISMVRVQTRSSHSPTLRPRELKFSIRSALTLS